MNRELLYRIKALMLMRVLVISGFLGTVLIFQLRIGQLPFILPISTLIASTYSLTIIYALLIGHVNNLKMFGYVQMVFDVFIETGVIYITGGIDSPFSFLYILSIISGSIILYRPGGYTFAAMSSILYGMMTSLDLYQVINPLPLFQYIGESSHGFVLYRVSLNISAFYLVAYLSGYLSEKLRKTGVELEVKSEDFLRLKTFHENVVNNMGGGLVAADIAGRIISFNFAAESITGYLFRDVSGKDIRSVFNLPGFSDSLDRLNHDFKMSGRWEGFFTKKDRQNVYLGMSLSLLKDDNDKSRGYIGVFQDLTVMKEMEEKVGKAERLAALGRVAAGIAHEIRNPLASISGSIQVLKERLKLLETDKKLMAIIVRETDSLNSIITDFLQYATPDKTKKEICCVNEIIEDTVMLLKNYPGLPGDISIDLSLKEGDLYISGDSKRLKQVLWNLCLNGIQAMHDSGGRLLLASQVTPMEPDDNRNECRTLEIVVQDSGVGISEEELHSVFDPFFSTKDTGTGLGLSTVYNIVEDHRGTINLKSEKGEGTKVTITLPLANY